MQPVPHCPAPICCWQTPSHEPLLRKYLQLGTYSVGFLFFFFSPVMLPSEIPKLPLTHLWEGFLLCVNFSSFITSSPGQVSIPKSFVSVFVFYILSYLLWKRLCCFSGCLVSSTSIQKLFCGNCSAFKWSFDEFVGEKVVSPSYSSAILGPPPPSGFCSLTYKDYNSVHPGIICN